MDSSLADRYDLKRFVEAQAGVYDQVCAELRAGKKRSHWMWFVFPQIRGLGSSPMAVRYAISGRDEARAYLDHPVLGPRLQECTGLVVDVEGRAGAGTTASEIFGYPDDLKFHSSMTLFAEVEGPSERVFHEALTKYFDGKADRATLDRL
jgi:uncharacterized protein (DUF1810 family)